ncbi:MAG TPA: zinc ribbon domain-containing protein, partial [Feifaniaceae bacterium]|nr:zinc ribbon domain-containing protein [Feifaniaceae bacterium]
MAFCSKCGTQIGEGEKVCPSCGTPVEGPVVTSGSNDTLMGVFAYLGILALIPYFSKGQSPFVRFHALQGMNLLILEIIAGVASGILSYVPVLGGIVSWVLSLGSLALSIIGIVNVANKEMKEL